jgi:hypothetical protein
VLDPDPEPGTENPVPAPQNCMADMHAYISICKFLKSKQSTEKNSLLKSILDI